MREIGYIALLLLIYVIIETKVERKYNLGYCNE